MRFNKDFNIIYDGYFAFVVLGCGVNIEVTELTTAATTTAAGAVTTAATTAATSAGTTVATTTGSDSTGQLR